jgi:hypothetical protein
VLLPPPNQVSLSSFPFNVNGVLLGFRPARLIEEPREIFTRREVHNKMLAD